MTDEQILNHYAEMVDIYGDLLPDPEQQPIEFAYFVKLYKYYHVQTD